MLGGLGVYGLCVRPCDRSGIAAGVRGADSRRDFARRWSLVGIQKRMARIMCTQTDVLCEQEQETREAFDYYCELVEGGMGFAEAARATDAAFGYGEAWADDAD